MVEADELYTEEVPILTPFLYILSMKPSNSAWFLKVIEPSSLVLATKRSKVLKFNILWEKNRRYWKMANTINYAVQFERQLKQK